VRLSRRYISGRQLPDKSVSLLDTACARVAMGHSATPPAIEDCQRTIDHVSMAMEILNREQSTGAKHDERLAELQKTKDETETRRRALQERWEKEKALVTRIREIRAQLIPPSNGRSAAKAKPASAPASESKSPPAKDAKSAASPPSGTASAESA